MTENGYLQVGKIVGAHGIKGLLKVYSYMESLSVFEPEASVLFRDSGGRERICVVRWAKPHKRQLFLLSLEGIHDRNQAEPMVGGELFVDKGRLPEPEDGEYYWTDLMGLSVFTEKGDCLGRISSIIETGSNDVYVVRDGKQETLVPALESVVRDINLEEKTMTVELPEGL